MKSFGFCKFILFLFLFYFYYHHHFIFYKNIFSQRINPIFAYPALFYHYFIDSIIFFTEVSVLSVEW